MLTRVTQAHAGDRGAVHTGLNVYMHSFDFTQGSAGSACRRQTRPYVELFSTRWTEGQTRWVMEDSSEEEVGDSPHCVLALSFRRWHQTRLLTPAR